ncbi:MAG: cytochrome c [Hyphomicrobiaceae bacterium]|nr:cytochrome c [Hyphomicrobiaceae bacterium]
MARLSGCVSCHTAENGEPFAGGVVLQSPFGEFVSPNITPHQTNGIGSWTLRDFSVAVREGISPDGEPYYPAFPYEFFASLTDRDLADIWAALQIVPEVSEPAPDHRVGFPFNVRAGLKLWRPLFERTFEYSAEDDQSRNWNLGRYLVEGPAHCGACHAPRNIAGGLELSEGIVGNSAMPGGGSAPPLTIAYLAQRNWTHENLVSALRTGVLPDGDVFGGEMAEIVRGNTSYYLSDHLNAMATYLLGEPE